MMLTAVIVEDMKDAMALLKSDIEKHHTNVKIINTAHSVVEAAKVLRKVQPDILFLDIMLGDGTGFDILEIFIIKSNLQILFVSSYVFVEPDKTDIRWSKFAMKHNNSNL